MKYEVIAKLRRSEALAELGSGEQDRVSTALVAIALHEPDRGWVEDRIAEHLLSPDPWVRGLAAVCAGHVARIHRALDTARLVPLIERLTDDPQTEGRAQDALSDIRMFIGGRSANS